MEAKPKELVEYETEDGKCPIKKWITSLDRTVATRIRARLTRLATGNFGDSKPVGEGVNELRIFFGAGYRVYFGLHKDELVILLCGGDKDSQNKDIETAKLYWAEFKRRNDVES